MQILILEISSLANQVSAAPVELLRKVWTISLSLPPYWATITPNTFRWA